jgi:hypothetical protein
MAWHDRYQKGRARDPEPATKVERRSKYGVEPYVRIKIDWLMAATGALTSVTQVRIALLLLRRWTMADKRNKGTTIPASRDVMSIGDWEPPESIRRRTLKLLEEAGLIRLIREGAGQAYRVKILQPHTDDERDKK